MEIRLENPDQIDTILKTLKEILINGGTFELPMACETIQRWSINLDSALGKGTVLLYGRNVSDNSQWIAEAVRTEDGWLFADDFRPPTENVKLIAWSEKVYPNLEEDVERSKSQKGVSQF